MVSTLTPQLKTDGTLRAPALASRPSLASPLWFFLGNTGKYVAGKGLRPAPVKCGPHALGPPAPWDVASPCSQFRGQKSMSTRGLET